jgi:hypothetical protein
VGACKLLRALFMLVFVLFIRASPLCAAEPFIQSQSRRELAQSILQYKRGAAHVGTRNAARCRTNTPESNSRGCLTERALTLCCVSPAESFDHRVHWNDLVPFLYCLSASNA